MKLEMKKQKPDFKLILGRKRRGEKGRIEEKEEGI